MDDERLPSPPDGSDADQAGAEPAPPTFLTLGHVLTGMGAEQDPPIGLDEIHLIRHSFRPSAHDGLRGPEDLAEARVREYTRSQDISTRRFPADPARYWVVLVADGKQRSRLYGTFENRGEVLAERTETATGICGPAPSSHPWSTDWWWGGAALVAGTG